MHPAATCFFSIGQSIAKGDPADGPGLDHRTEKLDRHGCQPGICESSGSSTDSQRIRSAAHASVNADNSTGSIFRTDHIRFLSTAPYCIQRTVRHRNYPLDIVMFISQCRRNKHDSFSNHLVMRSCKNRRVHVVVQDASYGSFHRSDRRASAHRLMCAL